MTKTMHAILAVTVSAMLTGCGSYPDEDTPAPGVVIGPVSVAIMPTGIRHGFPDAAFRIVSLPTGERFLMVSSGTANSSITVVLLPSVTKPE